MVVTGCGHTKGKSVVSRGEAYARVRAACDARDQGLDIFILARTDALVVGWEEAMTRAKEFKKMGVDAVFVEALPDTDAMRRCVEELQMPLFANSKHKTSTLDYSTLTLRPKYSHRRRKDREYLG